MDKTKEVLITLAIFVIVIIIGGLYIEQSRFGYTESALLYLSMTRFTINNYIIEFLGDMEWIIVSIWQSI